MLRVTFFPEWDNDELPAHRYLRSVHNIAIERSWLRLRLDFGDTAIAWFRKKGTGIGPEDFQYNEDDPEQAYAL